MRVERRGRAMSLPRDLIVRAVGRCAGHVKKRALTAAIDAAKTPSQLLFARHRAGAIRAIQGCLAVKGTAGCS